jgi:hypothetical protein
MSPLFAHAEGPYRAVRKPAATSLAFVVAAYVLVLIFAGVAVMRSISAVERLNSDSNELSIAKRRGSAEVVFRSFEHRLDNLESITVIGTAPFKLMGWTPLGDIDQFSKSMYSVAHRLVGAGSHVLASTSKLEQALDLVEGGASFTELLDGGELEELLESAREAAIASESELTAIQRIIDEQATNYPGWLVSLVRDRLDPKTAEVQELSTYVLALTNLVDANVEMARLSSDFVEKAVSFTGAGADIPEYSRDTEAIAAVAQEALGYAGIMRSSSPGIIAGTRYEDIANQVIAVDSAVFDITNGMSNILLVVGDITGGLAGSDGSILREPGKMKDIMDSLIDSNQDLSSWVIDIERGIGQLSEAQDIPIFPTSMSDLLVERTSSLNLLSQVLIDAPPIAEEILGLDGNLRRFLVLGLTSDELRAAGGFTSSAWVLEFRDGVLVESEYFSVLTIDDVNNLSRGSAVPEALSVHMDAGATYIRDIGWSPHFPDVARYAIDLTKWKIGHIDGVVALNQWAYQSLTQGMGTVNVDDVEIGAGQVMNLLETSTDAEGTDGLIGLFDALVDGIGGERMRARAVPFLMAVNGSLHRNEMLIYSVDSDTQSRLENVGWSGSFFRPEQDVLYIIDSNVGWNKSDRNVDRSFEYTVDLRNPLVPSAILTLEYRNRSIIGSDECEFQKHISSKNPTFEELKNRCYWNYLRAYVPEGVDLIRASESNIPAGAVAVRSGSVPQDADSMRLDFDVDGTHISGLVVVAPGDSESVSFEYSLPPAVVTIEADVVEYKLQLRAQPGVVIRNGSVKILLPEGFILDETVGITDRESDSIISSKLELSTDTHIVVTGSVRP